MDEKEQFPLCAVRGVQFEQLKSELKDLKGRITTLEGSQKITETFNVRMEENLKNYDSKFNRIEIVLDNIVTEIRGIGDKLIYMRARDEKVDENDESGKDGLITTMVTANNKALWVAIVILGASLLLSLGAKVDEIAKLIGIG